MSIETFSFACVQMWDSIVMRVVHKLSDAPYLAFGTTYLSLDRWDGGLNEPTAYESCLRPHEHYWQHLSHFAKASSRLKSDQRLANKQS